MTLDQLMERIESPELEIELNVASGTRTFIKAARRADVFTEVVDHLRERGGLEHVIARTVELLAKQPEDGEREHPHDTSLAVYLLVLEEVAPSESMSMARSLAARGDTWWARKVASRALEAVEDSDLLVELDEALHASNLERASALLQRLQVMALSPSASVLRDVKASEHEDLRGDVQAALRLARRAFLAAEHLVEQETPWFAAAVNLAWMLIKTGALDEAFELDAQIQRACRHSQPSDTLAIALLHGRVLLESNEVLAARSLLEREFESSSVEVGTASWLSLVSTLAEAYEKSGDRDDAIELVGDALEAAARRVGDTNPAVLDTAFNLAGWLIPVDLDAAERLSRYLLETAEAQYGAEHPFAVVRSHLALIALRRGHIAEAVTNYRAAIQVASEHFGEQYIQTLGLKFMLAQALLASGDVLQAHDLHLQVYSDRVDTLGPRHPDTEASRRALAEIAERHLRKRN